jgi:hypothetical protein
MKFTDVRTLNSVLKEYGLKAGSPTPVGQQPTVGIPAPSKEPTKALKKDLGSPTVTPGLEIPDADEPEAIAPLSVKAKDFDDGSEYLNDKGEVAGKVISKVGKGPAIKKLVVQDPDGEYTLIDPEEELLAAPVTEAKGGKYSKKVHKTALRKTSKSKNSISSVKQKIKKLARKVQMQEQGAEQLFELNFNTKEIIQSGLDSPIKCGFEAESLWEGYDSGYSEDPDEMSWIDIEEKIEYEYGNSTLETIQDNFREWVMEEKMMDYEADLTRELIIDRKEDSDYIDEFMERASPLSDEDLASALAKYKKYSKKKDPAEYKSKIEDGWTDDNWRREFVEETYQDEFIEWLEEEIRDNGEVFEPAMEAALDDTSMEDWRNESYNGYWTELLSDHEVYIGDENSSSGNLEGVADEIRSWAQDNSMTDSIEVGEYHSGGINNAYWRVEDDSSIEGEGIGSEIISPVYGTPREMLEEMTSLFSNWESKDVETNGSTGLHVTMSLDPTKTDMSADADINKVKLAVLLGDKYLASTFGRENNTYAKSQYDRLEKKAVELKANPTSTKTIEAIEQILERGISSDKFSSINFKNQQDDKSGYNLVEFRIGGGTDYHEDMPKIVKSVVRYATTLRAGYTDEYNQDYVKALFKLINNVGRISADLEDRVKDRYKLEHPVIDVLKGFFSKDNYMESMGVLARAFEDLNEYKEASKPEADHEWRHQVAKYEKGTGKKLEIQEVEQGEPIRGYLKPDLEAPSKRAPKLLQQAQKYFAYAIAQAGYDLNQNLNREVVNVKAIGTLRKSLQEFELTYETLSTAISTKSISDIKSDDSQTDELLFNRVKNGVDRLFKKDVVASPDFLSGQQLEKIVSGIWNAINSGEDISNDKKLIDLIVNASGKNANIEPLFLDKNDHRYAGGNANLTLNTYVKLHNKIASTSGDWFSVGKPILSKDYTALIKKLKTYPVWDEAVAKTFDLRNPRNDPHYGKSVSPFADASIENMLAKLDRRIQALDKLYTTNPELYIESIKQLADSTEKLINVVHDPSSPHEKGEGFHLEDNTYEEITNTIKRNHRLNFRPSPFEDNPAEQIYDPVHRFIRDGLKWYYASGSRGDGNPGPAAGGATVNYGTPEGKKGLKKRTDAIKTFLNDVDKISQNMGFDSQAKEIKSKLQQHTRGDDFQKKHIGPAPATVTVFNYGGYIFVDKELAKEMRERVDINDGTSDQPGPSRADAEFYKNFNFSDSMFQSDAGRVLIIPHAHYFAAFEAYEIDKTSVLPDSNAPWRVQSSKKILRAFHAYYGITFSALDGYTGSADWVKIQFGDLQDHGIEVIKKGDGREGAPPYNFDPLVPREEINGPGGEPFERNSASAWRVNNPELDKKFPRYDAPADGRKITPPAKGVSDTVDNIATDYVINQELSDVGHDVDYSKARREYQLFDRIYSNGLDGYIPVEDAPKLVAFLNNTDNDEGFKLRVLTAIADNFEAGLDQMSLALAMGTARSLESVFYKFDKLTLQEQIRIINQSEVLERPLTKDEEDDKEKYVKGMKKNKKDFKKRYGKNADAVMYATATKMAKENIVTEGIDSYAEAYYWAIHAFKKFIDTETDWNDDPANLFFDPNNPDADPEIGVYVDWSPGERHIVSYHASGRAPGGVESAQLYITPEKDYRPHGDVSDILGAIENGQFTGVVLQSKDNKTTSPKINETLAANTTHLAPPPKKKLNFRYPDIKKKTNEDGVPNLNKIRILNKILADHFPVSDLYKQMLAYQAIPIPQMLSDFRGLRAGAGDDACARGIVRHYINALSKEEQKQINLQEWSKSKVRALIESKGIMGRVYGDTFLNGDDKLEFKQVDLYPLEEMKFENAESRDVYIQQLEQENNLQIEWTNKPNAGSLAFGLATLTDPMLDDKMTYWGRYFREKTANMMGKWGNSQVPIGWKLQTAGALKLDIGIDPQHLIKTDDPFNGVIEVIQAVKTNSTGTELSDSLVTALETIHTQQHPVFPGQIANLPALRDYFGEIMGPVALMSEMVRGQADAARDDLLQGQPWASCKVFWPMAMNAPLVDSYFTAPDGTRVGISSKGGKGAKASVRNIADAIAKAPEEMKVQYQTTVNIVDIVQSNTAKDGPFRLAEMYGALPEGLEAEINGYIQEGKKDYIGISPASTELFNYGTPKQDIPGFNVGFALLALLAKKVTRLINESGPEFGLGCVAFLNQSSIVQLYCKMGKNGQDARVTGWDAVYPPNFQGTVQIDGSKNYYSSRIGGKFAFGFK